jgi:hypothetical protein
LQFLKLDISKIVHKKKALERHKKIQCMKVGSHNLLRCYTISYTTIFISTKENEFEISQTRYKQNCA